MRSSNPAERLAAALLIPGVLAQRLRELSDFNLGQLLEDEVWSNLNLLAPESVICLVAADRLRQTSRPTKGELNGYENSAIPPQRRRSTPSQNMTAAWRLRSGSNKTGGNNGNPKEPFPQHRSVGRY
jgi:hypothetical protein